MIRTARVRKKIVRGVCRVCGCKDCPWGIPSLRLHGLERVQRRMRMGRPQKKDSVHEVQQ